MIVRRKQPAVTRDAALGSKPRRLVEVAVVLDEAGGGKLNVPLAPPRWGRWVTASSR